MNEHEFSDRRLKVLIVLAFLIIGWLCFRGASSGHAQSAPSDLSPGVQEVIKLTKAHMTDDVILAYIRNSGSSYNLSADDVLYLNSQGVSQPVISALLQAKSAAPAPLPVATTTPAPTPISPPITIGSAGVNPPGMPGTPAAARWRIRGRPNARFCGDASVFPISAFALRNVDGHHPRLRHLLDSRRSIDHAGLAPLP